MNNSCVVPEQTPIFVNISVFILPLINTVLVKTCACKLFLTLILPGNMLSRNISTLQITSTIFDRLAKLERIISLEEHFSLYQGIWELLLISFWKEDGLQANYKGDCSKHKNRKYGVNLCQVGNKWGGH